MKTPQLLKVGKISLALKRFQLPVYIKGKLVQAPPKLVYIHANVQPAIKQTASSFMSEEVKTKKGLILFSKSEIRAAMDHGNTKHQADRFVYNNEEYEVVKVIRYQMGVLDHYEALALFLNPAEVREATFSPTPVGMGISATGTALSVS